MNIWMNLSGKVIALYPSRQIISSCTGTAAIFGESTWGFQGSRLSLSPNHCNGENVRLRKMVPGNIIGLFSFPTLDFNSQGATADLFTRRNRSSCSSQRFWYFRREHFTESSTSSTWSSISLEVSLKRCFIPLQDLSSLFIRSLRTHMSLCKSRRGAWLEEGEWWMKSWRSPVRWFRRSMRCDQGRIPVAITKRLVLNQDMVPGSRINWVAYRKREAPRKGETAVNARQSTSTFRSSDIASLRYLSSGFNGGRPGSWLRCRTFWYNSHGTTYTKVKEYVHIGKYTDDWPSITWWR